MSGDNHTNLHIDPSTELVFTGPFTSVVTSHLYLKNNGSKPLCYKIKTTAPRMYCVRPNSGLIEAGKDVDISVMLQPFDFNVTERLKHKFLIQSTVVEDNNEENYDQLWKSVNNGDISEMKLRCVFNNEISGDVNSSPLQEENTSNNLQPGLLNSVDEMKKELEKLKNENVKLKETEAAIRKAALHELQNDTIPQIIEHTKQSSMNNVMLLLVLCLVSFVIGLVISKFTF